MFPMETSAWCNAANLAEPSSPQVRHANIFGRGRVLHHGALKGRELEDYTAFFQIFRNDIALDQLIVREDAVVPRLR